MTRKPRLYQIMGVDKIATKIGKGIMSMIFQLATGGGKSVTFALLIFRFLAKFQKKVVILVHREELLHQAIRTLFEWYDIMAVPVTAETKYLPNAMVYVAMVETANNRLKKNPKYFGNIGMLIIDEVHRGEHKKIYSYFKDAFRVGFTATPLASDKKYPLKNHFEDIICGIDIPELIAMNKLDSTTGLVENMTVDETGILRKELRVKGPDFDMQQMATTFSGTRHVLNTVKAYRDCANGKKSAVFNCNIEHSILVRDAFRAAGYPCEHLDGEIRQKNPKEFARIMTWFKQTKGAILCNYDIASTGFDVPSIECVIMNCATKSLTKWLQCCGRGSRPYPGKEYFIIIDMGGNAETLGDWCVSHNWDDIFRNPEKWYDRKGEAPSKKCKNCHRIIHAAANSCKFCGADNRKVIEYDQAISIDVLMGQKPFNISVSQLIAETAEKKYKEISCLHTVKYRLCWHAKHMWKIRRLDDKTALRLLKIYQGHVMTWCKEVGKINQFDEWLNYTSKKWFFEELQRSFGWVPINKREKQKV